MEGTETPKQKKNLSEFYIKTNGNNWKCDSNWISDESLKKWYGITSKNELIIKINLKSNNLSGSLIPTSFPSSLQYLYLPCNELTGSVPNDFPSSLRSLDLSGNKLTGSLPTVYPSSLESLTLKENNLTGPIPWFPSSLEYLNLSDNELSGSVPSSLPESLQYLNLDGNRLTGPVPAVYPLHLQ
eukprot:UN33254